MIAIFYGSSNMNQINSLELYFFDPKYKDDRVIVLDINKIISWSKNGSWSNSSH